MLTQEALDAYKIVHAGTAAKIPHDNSANQIAETARAKKVTIKQVIAPRLQSDILSSITVKRQCNQCTVVINVITLVVN